MQFSTFSWVFVIVCFKIGPHYVVVAGLELTIDLAGLKLNDPPAFVSWLLRLEVCATIIIQLYYQFFFLKKYFKTESPYSWMWQT